MNGMHETGVTQPSTPNANSFPGMQIGKQNGYTYNGPKINYDLNSASNLRQYNLQEYVYGYGTDNAKNGNNGNGSGSNGSNNGSGSGGIISDIENLPTIDYLLIAGALIIVVMLI